MSDIEALRDMVEANLAALPRRRERHPLRWMVAGAAFLVWLGLLAWWLL